MRTHANSVEIDRHQQKQMLKLVAESFYRELINYGVSNADVISVAGHLLDNIMQKRASSSGPAEYHNRLFTTRDVRDEWTSSRRLSVHEVSISPVRADLIPRIADWLRAPAVRESFHPPFPNQEQELGCHLHSPSRDYFVIFCGQEFVGIIGAEHVDTASAKLEMRKLVGDPAMHGRGIGKRATFLFLHYAFMIRRFEKVYVHSMDTNIRNLNLNAKFGFELEGFFLGDIALEDRRLDVIRMALHRTVYLSLFAA